MHESLRLYDASLRILAQETAAIENEEEDTLPELCEKRMALMEEAWEKRAGCDPVLLLEKLEAIREAQASLTCRANTEVESLRLALQDSRRENIRLAGYGKVVANRQSAIFMSKEG